MKKLENMLEHRLNEDQSVPYPDFDSMWGRIEQETTAPVHARMSRGSQNQRRNWSKVAVVASLSVLLAAAPVYAAVHYNWDTMLRGRGGIQAVLAKNLGQQLDQSVTKDGVTLKLHTAIVDENRTVILFTLDVGQRQDSETWRVNEMTLKGTEGESSSGSFNYLNWDEKNQIYNGYFESEWTPKQDTVDVQLVTDNMQAFSVQMLDLPLDIHSTETQSFPIGQEGMRSIEVKPFTQGQEKMLFSSAIIFDQPEAKEWAYPNIVGYKNGTLINSLPGGTFGTPGEKGEYTAQQYFKAEDISSGRLTYKLQYMKKEKDVKGPLAFDLHLSKKQMESGTIKTSLNLPLEVGETDHTLENMVVSPTQIRVTVRSKDIDNSFPYKKYALEVSGKTLEGKLWSSPEGEPELTVLRFERPVDLEITKETPITFVAKYKVTQHGSYKISNNNDDKIPLLITNISQKKQTIIQQLSGYPVKWTYYMQGSDLYVETGSEDARFGGINQTHIGLGKERILGKPVTVNFAGDGNNKAIDVYKDFKGTEASIYMFYYTTDDPEKETRVQIQP
ncbi:DUF4179 domain-containing protein [Paenibacillus sp.]|uniref:DUF4179 domain-containing protein n=1 Tax=Paenibacillus sp. TaxID=58172 RepID=UPI0028AA4AC9|nr:DUF4179 domain-containing protein [Paenibacillus sp.]